MGPPSYMLSVVDRNFVKRRMTVVNRLHKLTVERNKAKYFSIIHTIYKA